MSRVLLARGWPWDGPVWFDVFWAGYDPVEYIARVIDRFHEICALEGRDDIQWVPEEMQVWGDANRPRIDLDTLLVWLCEAEDQVAQELRLDGDDDTLDAD